MASTDVLQYVQSENVDTSDALTDMLESSSKNKDLDELQIKNIGIGLLGDSPVSETTGRLNTNIGFDRINQSFKIILRTVLGEVPMLPILGSNLSNLLFEPIDELTDDSLQLAIETSIGQLEPRVKIMTTTISHDRQDENMIHIEIEYVLTNTNIVYVFRDSIVTGNGGDEL